jgi:hypothetical protein
MRQGNFVLLLLLLSLTGCDTIDALNSKLIAYAAIGLIGGYFANKRNKKTISEDMTMINEFEKRKLQKKYNQAAEVNTDDTSPFSSSNESGQAVSGEIERESGTFKGNFVGRYVYSEKGLTTILVISIVVLLLGVAFSDAGDEREMPIYFHGYIFFIIGSVMLLTWMIVFIINIFREKSNFIYELYDNQIDVFRKNKEFLFSLKWSEIENIDVDYKTTPTRTGEQITRITYNIKVRNKEESCKIDVYGYINPETNTKLKDDFQRILLPQTS